MWLVRSHQVAGLLAGLMAAYFHWPVCTKWGEREGWEVEDGKKGK